MAEQWKNKQSSKISFLLKKSKLTLYLNANYAYNIYIFKTHAYCDYTKKNWLLFKNILKNLYAHNILFRKAKKNINNYGLFVVRYFYVL